MEHNIDDVPELTLRGRMGNGAHKRLSFDIFELKRFIKVESNVFQNETVTDSARYMYVTFKKNYTHIIEGENEEGEVRKDNIAVSQEITDLKFKLVEKDNKIRDMESKLMAIEKRFSNMKKSYNSLQAEVAGIKLLVGSINSRTKGNAGSSTPKEL